MATLEEYQTKKAALEAEQETVKREIILTESSISQQQQVFQQQFNTVDIVELKKIGDQYAQSILAKEQELALLEQES